jgi:hypothetical protein
MRPPRLLPWFPADWQLGPLLRLEVVRLARCTRVHWLRVGYAVALLAALALAYWRSFPTLSAGELLTSAGGVLALNDQAGFAERFVDSLFFVQFLAIILLTPVYCGSAITEERERGTLDLLLSAPLADGEILLLKMLTRTLLLVGVLIGTVPFIAVVFALGGVSWSSIMWRLTGNLLALLCLATLAVIDVRARPAHADDRVRCLRHHPALRNADLHVGLPLALGSSGSRAPCRLRLLSSVRCRRRGTKSRVLPVVAG